MIQDILTQCDIRIKSLFEHYCKFANEQNALIMACCECGKPELVEPLINLERENQRILMEETYKCLVPMGTPLPEDAEPQNKIDE